MDFFFQFEKYGIGLVCQKDEAISMSLLDFRMMSSLILHQPEYCLFQKCIAERVESYRVRRRCLKKAMPGHSFGNMV